MTDTTITIQPRTVTGKKVAGLRREGVLPANIYGPLVKGSFPVQVSVTQFRAMYKSSGETELINLIIEGESESRPVLIHDVQVEPVSGDPSHVDFYQVDMTKKVDVEVPFELIGEAPAIQNKRGEMLQVLEFISLRVLPGEIPHNIEVDISSLENVGDQITVGDLSFPQSVELLSAEPEDLIVKINEIIEVTAEDLATPEPEAEPGEEGATGVEGEEGTEESPKE